MRSWLKEAWLRFQSETQALHLRFADGAVQPPPLARREITILLSTAVLLVIYFYYGRTGTFYQLWWPRLEGQPWLARIGPEWYDLLPYAYWAAASIVLRLIVPALIILFILRERLGDYGFGFGRTAHHLWLYACLYLLLLPALIWLSTDPAFQEKYPFYRAASQGGAHFWLYQITYGLQFLALEAFFRGFLLFGLYKRMGAYAILIMSIPYCMIHFGKPPIETFAAIGAGVILGVLALRTRSFYPGFLLHWAVGLTMDSLALAPNALPHP